MNIIHDVNGSHEVSIPINGFKGTEIKHNFAREKTKSKRNKKTLLAGFEFLSRRLAFFAGKEPTEDQTCRCS